MAETWESAEYQTIVGAILDSFLHVDFADGTTAKVELGRLLPPGQEDAVIEAVDHNDHEVVVRADGDPLEISWLDIRAQSDPEFGEFLVQTADAEAQRIGQRLRQLRERRGMTGKQVAEAAGIAPMSLSRIELGRHDVVYRTLRRILAAMNYGLDDLAAVHDEPVITAEAVAKRLSGAGLPKNVVERMRRALGDAGDRMAEAAARIFGWSTEALQSRGALTVTPSSVGGIFKSQINQNPELATYTLWVHYLAHLVDQACPRPPADLPESASAIRDEVVRRHGRVSFDALLDFCWSQNIAVLPLHDPGEFHGACWSFDGRVVVVLKQITPWASRWAFDLAHELGHVARHLDDAGGAVVELGEITPVAAADDDEQEANDFAGTLLLDDADELAQELARRTELSLPRLKQEVVRLAEERQVETDALANYMAYRLNLEDENWWSTAAKLQDDSGAAPRRARDALLERADLDEVSDDDAALLEAALDWS